MTLLWIAIADRLTLVLIVGYFVLQRAVTGRRYDEAGAGAADGKARLPGGQSPDSGGRRLGFGARARGPARHELRRKAAARDLSSQKRCEGHDSAVSRLQILLADRLRARASGFTTTRWATSLLLVDQRAHGSSQGKYLTFGVRERLDVLSWATYMGQKLGQNAPLILGGLSMGATTVLLASCFDFPANVRAVIADCGFTSPYEIAKASLRRDYPKAPVSLLLPLCSLVTRLFAGFGLRDGSTIDAVRESRYPILFLHGTGDTFVPYEMTKRAFDACTAPKRMTLSRRRRARQELCHRAGRASGPALEAFLRYLYTVNKGGARHESAARNSSSAAPLLEREPATCAEPGWARSAAAGLPPQSQIRVSRHRASRSGTTTS